jgi:hypothetical protein
VAKKIKSVVLEVKCDVSGCERRAIHGFRRLISTSTFDTTGFRSEPFNCCDVHLNDAERDYSGPDVKRVHLGS